MAWISYPSVVAGDPGTLVATLETLADDSDCYVLTGVAENPNTPTAVLSALASDDHPGGKNLDDLRRLVHILTERGVHIEFVKERLTVTGEDSPMATFMLAVMGAFAVFERALLRERPR